MGVELYAVLFGLRIAWNMGIKLLMVWIDYKIGIDLMEADISKSLRHTNVLY